MASSATTMGPLVAPTKKRDLSALLSQSHQEGSNLELLQLNATGPLTVYRPRFYN